MRTTIDSKIYPANSDKINRIEVILIYNSDIKRYYISIQPQKIEKIGSIEFVSVAPFDCQTVLLQLVKRRSKKQDAIALDKFLSITDELAEQMVEKYNAESESRDFA